jgi:hypothetical protein
MPRFTFALPAALLLGWVLHSPVAMAALTPDQEAQLLQEAETSMVGGQYARAIPVYARLFGETRKPVYLRNLGRCHQFLKHADEAILTFRQYLNQTGDAITPAERAEVQGFIKEMEDLKRQQGEAPRANASTEGAPPAALTATTPSAGAPTSSTEATSPTWKKPAGYALGAAGLVGVAVGGLLAVTGANKANSARDSVAHAPTPDGWDRAKRDFDSGQSRNQTGWIVAGVGAAALAGGIFLVVTAPEQPPRKDVAVTPFLVAHAAGLAVDCNW